MAAQRIVGIDSMVLIYAGVVPSNPNTKIASPLRDRARILLHLLENDTIVLPTISVSELLVPVPENKKGILLSKLTDHFLIPTFDKRAASLAARIWADHKKLPADMWYKQRHVLRADTMIIASAKTAGATIFYTHDRKCRALAKNFLDARDLPDSDPNDMFAKQYFESLE